MAGPSSDIAASCLADEELRAVLVGHDSDPVIEAHLGDCERCQQRLEALSGSLPIEGNDVETPYTTSEALDTAMRELKTHPLEVKRDLQSWLVAVGATEADGELLGRLEGFELVRVIGEGGMGLVIEARDPRLDRSVAIKLIKPTIVADKRIQERLLREAQAAARIQHDCVVPIYTAELTSTGSVPFMVMPNVTHGTLQDRLDAVGGPLPIEEVVSIGEQMAAALAAAHGEGVIHRDVKPANVLLRGDGQIWLADFGVARALDDVIQGNAEQEISGTPQFMAPEQLEGNESDHRADLFSLGAVLYAMATGESAFTSNSREAHQSIFKSKAEIPEWLGTVIEALLHRSPDKRPQTAVVVRDRLRKGRLAEARGLPVLAIAALVTLLLAGMAIVWKTRPPEWQSAPFLLPQQEAGFHSLPEAIEAAEPGAVIEIQTSGLVYHGLLEPLSKPLGIRAINGATPRIEGVLGMKPLVVTRAPLVLEGIHFLIDCSPNTEMVITPPIIETSGPLAATNCIFAQLRADDGPSRLQASLIVLDSAGETSLTNCVFVNRISNAFGVGGEHNQVILENCFVHSRTAFYPKRITSELTSFTARRSAFHAREFAIWKERNLISPITFDVTESVLDTEIDVFGFPGRTLAEVSDNVTFHGQSNLYNKHAIGYLGLVPPGRLSKRGARIGTLQDWLRFWELSETGSDSREVEFKTFDTDGLHTDVLAGLKRDLKASDAFSDRGIDQALLGPGPAYERFLKTNAHEQWRKRAEALLRSSTESNPGHPAASTVP